MLMRRMRRRRFLAATACTLSTVAGCTALRDTVPFVGSDPKMLSPETTGEPISLPGDSVDDGGWPQPAHDAGNTRYAPGADPPGAHAAIAWRSPEIRSLYPPIATEDVYLTERWTNGAALSLDRQDGTKRWENRSFPSMRWAPAVQDERMFVLTRARGNIVRLHALGTEEGQEQWTRVDDVTATANSGLTLSGDTLFVPTATGVAAFDTETGEHYWGAKLAEHVKGSRVTRWPKPAVRDGQVYTFDTLYGADEGDLPVYALDMASGDPVWTTEVELRKNWEPQSQYAVAGRENVFLTAGEVVYRPLGDSSDVENTPVEITALDTDSGEISWKWRLKRDLAPMAYADGYLFVPTRDLEAEVAELHALNVQEGTIAWTYRTRTDRIGAPTVTSDKVYVSNGTALVCLAVADGSRIMRLSFEDEREDFPNSSAQVVNPVAAHDALYVLVGNPGQPNESRVYCVHSPE